MAIYKSTELTNSEYHAHESLSKSGIDLLMRSPAHYRFAPQNEPTRAMVIGSALHAAILEPDVFEAQYMLLPSVTDRRASEYKEAAKHYGDDFVLTDKEADYITGMVETVRSHETLAPALLRPHDVELSIITTDKATGVPIRARFDWLGHDLLAIDLKTTTDARPDAFMRSIAAYNYHVQAAFYEHVFEQETGEKLQAFQFAAIEKEAPHGIGIYELDDIALKEGRRVVDRALETYARCLDSGHWPSYDAGVQYLTLPPWAIESDEEIGVLA